MTSVQTSDTFCMEVFYMKKYVIAAVVLAVMLALSPTALADSYHETGSPVSFEGSILEVIASEAINAENTTPEPTGSAPVAENQEIETYRGVSVGGQLTATDPDGGTLYYELTTEPVKGKVVLSADGYFVYTPDEGKRGKDYFAFRVTDEQSNKSQEGTVLIRLMRQRTDVCYADLDGDGCAYSATVLAENGIFIGERVGTDWVFSADESVSRGEFLSMCMVLGGEDIVQGVLSTGFMDDGDIDGWVKPYVSTALMNGYIGGTGADGAASFLSSDGVTLGDACSMLNAVVGVTDVVSVSAVDEGNQAVANLRACGILTGSAPLDTPVTRRSAAELLAGALDVMNRR